MKIELRTMNQEDLYRWIRWSRDDYAKDRVLSGESEELAKAKAELSFATYFPDGAPLESHFVYDVFAGEEVVGYLWIGPESPARGGAWWVWDVGVYTGHRGNGYGRAAMLLAEDEVTRQGGLELGLHVFGFNTAARALYDSLGYTPTSIRMSKKLG
ncbi:GNAT family N-acetyltransferase [Arthrobacter sp. GMC3]|uniref:GNAT family N-acetyltransferase n=1 Tax=Arthrobacter sp. GMC3 TaxID=2058894 RepID=UPI000CE4FE4A|nr:GNAT family N-acetyltransferase [Arthrobacter sp. GMC3]